MSRLTIRFPAQHETPHVHIRQQGGEIGAPCGLPRPSSLLRVVRCTWPPQESELWASAFSHFAVLQNQLTAKLSPIKFAAMIPGFTDNGFLPPGVHPAKLDEIEARFGRQSEIRGVQMQSIHWMVDLAVKAGAVRVVLNGSFVTDIMEPNDVDCVLLFYRGRRKSQAAFKELRAGLPFLDIVIASPKRFEEFVSGLFAADRYGAPKGMVEVIYDAAE